MTGLTICVGVAEEPVKPPAPPVVEDLSTGVEVVLAPSLTKQFPKPKAAGKRLPTRSLFNTGTDSEGEDSDSWGSDLSA